MNERFDILTQKVWCSLPFLFVVQNCVLVGWSGYLSHLNHRGGELMTPDEEIKVTIVRRETEKRMAQKELQKTID